MKKEGVEMNRFQGGIMTGMPKMRGRLVIALSVALFVLYGHPIIGSSFAAEETGEKPVVENRSESKEITKPAHFAYINGYPEGKVKPLEKITREETAEIFYRLLPEECRKANYSKPPPFPDVNSGQWSCEAITALYYAEILKGNPDGNFRPSEPITRAEFAAIAARFDKLEDSVRNSFPDTKAHWAEKYINSSVEMGWIKGYGDGTFRPDNAIIRCEAMMLINEVLDRHVNTAGIHNDTKQWPDNTPDKWYFEIVLEATNTHDYERADRPRSTERWTAISENPVW